MDEWFWLTWKTWSCLYKMIFLRIPPLQVNHHSAPPFGRILFLEACSKHHGQANPSWRWLVPQQLHVALIFSASLGRLSRWPFSVYEWLLGRFESLKSSISLLPFGPNKKSPHPVENPAIFSTYFFWSPLLQGIVGCTPTNVPLLEIPI